MSPTQCPKRRNADSKSDQARSIARPLSPLSDAAIERGIRFGTDFSKWYRDLEPLVRSIIASRVPNVSSHDDCAQEIWSRVFKSLPRYDPLKSQPQTWVIRIARNTLVDLSRRASARVLLKSESDMGGIDGDTAPFIDTRPTVRGEEQDPLSQLIAKEARDAVVLSASNLSPTQAEIMHLKYGKGCTVSAISATSGSPIGTVKSTLSRGLAVLRRPEDEAA